MSVGKACVQVLGTMVIVMVVAGCQTRQLRSNYDSSIDFSQYKTYNFYTEAGPRDSEYRRFFSEYMIRAISREMDARGYVKSDDPDLLINFNGVLKEKTRVTTHTEPMVSGWDNYYGYRTGYYDPLFDSGYGMRIDVSEYTEGTFNIDLVDAKRKKLVWEVVGVSNISQRELAELEDTINEGVPHYFAEYPFKAGDS